MRDVPIEDPDPADLGPAMLALNPAQRRFVVGWIQSRGKNAARVARAAGYSDKAKGAKVAASRLQINPKVMRALHEEAGRRLDGMAAIAVSVLELNMAGTSPKARQAAADSVLDRTGYARRTEQAVQVEHRGPKRSAEELVGAVLEKLRVHMVALPAPIEGEFSEVSRETMEKADVEQAVEVAGVTINNDGS